MRGLAYYTGVVFEAFDRAGKLRAIAGGGRYDNLIQQLSDGAVSLPAVGFAMGDVVLGELIDETPASYALAGQARQRPQRNSTFTSSSRKRNAGADALSQFATTARRRLSRRLSAHADESRAGNSKPPKRLGARVAIALRRRMAGR